MSSSFRRSGSTSSRPTQTPLSSSSTSLHQQDKDHSPSIPHQSSISTSSSKRPLSSPSPAAVLERVGTKPWIGGLTLTSTGLRELDAIVGGGQPLGTAILVEEDRWTQDLALCLVRYWSAEALAQGQTLALMSTLQDVDELDVSDDALEHVTRRPNLQGVSPCGLESFLHMLPRDLHLDKVREKTRLLETRTLVTSTREEEEQQRQGGGGGGAEAVSTTTTTDMATTTVSGNTSSRLDFGTIQEEEEEEEDDDNFDKEEEATGIIKDDKVSNVDADEGLVNAWQYKVSVQRERMGDVMAFSKNSSSSSSSSGGEKVYCHSYDLGGKMMDQHDEHWSNPKDNPHMHIIHCSCSKCPPLCCEESKDCAVALFQSCLVQIQEKMAQHPKTVIRLLILNAPMKKIAMALPLLLSYIRHHSLPVVMFVTVRPWQQSCPASTMSSSDTQKALVSLRRVCDAVFACEGFSSMITHPPLEFSDLAGILSIRKIALQALSHFSDTTTSRRPPANRYGMKRDRRKMTIRMLHLPPEDFSAGGSSVGSGARSGGGKVQTDHDSKGGIRGGGGSSSSTDNGTSSTSRATALVPGMSCASHMRQPNNSSQSLDF